MRPSNTTPVIVLRFEADTEKKLQEIQDQFKSILRTHITRKNSILSRPLIYHESATAHVQK